MTWTALALHERRCPLCGDGERSRLYAESNIIPHALDGSAFASRKVPEYMHWRLVTCRRCDLLYATPVLAADQLATLYRDAAFDSGEMSRHASRTYGRLLERIYPRLPNRVGAVDVGAGDGTFLRELLAAGFTEVVGIEPSLGPIANAEETIRPLIRASVFQPNSFSANSLSLVTCFQTIEHLDNPLQFCRAAFQMLKPGGALLLVAHNRCAISARILGRKSPIFDIEHLQLFTRPSLRRLFSKAGFERIDVWPILNCYPLHYWGRLFPFPHHWKNRLLTLLQGSRIGSIPLPLPAGNLAAVGYRTASSAGLH